MANPNRGEVELKAGDKTYRFRLSTNVLCEMEDHFDKSFNEVMEELAERPSIKGLRTIVRFALSENDDAPDDKAAGEIIDTVGPAVINEKLKKAIEVAFPQPEGTTENPQKAAGGTGKGS